MEAMITAEAEVAIMRVLVKTLIKHLNTSTDTVTSTLIQR